MLDALTLHALEISHSRAGDCDTLGQQRTTLSDGWVMQILLTNEGGPQKVDGVHPSWLFSISYVWLISR